MGYGADFGGVGASAVGGGGTSGAIGKKLESKINSGGGGGGSKDGGGYTDDAGMSDTIGSDSDSVSNKKYNPKKHAKCHKKHTHSKSCGGKR